MKLDFQKITIDAKWVALEFSTGIVNTISPVHFITLKREKLDIPQIESNVRARYTEEISKGLFDAELQKQMEEEVRNAVERRKQEIMDLPHPTIFTCSVAGFKNSWETTNFKVWVSDDTAIYFIKNREDILKMEFNLENYPFYLEWVQKAKAVLEYKDKFASKIPHTEPIDDCFQPYIQTINSYAEFNKDTQKYENPEYKWDFDVITNEDEQWNIYWEKLLLTLDNPKKKK